MSISGNVHLVLAQGQRLRDHGVVLTIEPRSGGRLLAEASPANLLELGGNAPVLVFEDADVDTGTGGRRLGRIWTIDDVHRGELVHCPSWSKS